MFRNSERLGEGKDLLGVVSNSCLLWISLVLKRLQM